MDKVLHSRAGFESYQSVDSGVRTNFWLICEPREHDDKNYQRVAKKLSEDRNRDVQAIGKILLSLPSERGYKLVHDLNQLLPKKL